LTGCAPKVSAEIPAMWYSTSKRAATLMTITKFLTSARWFAFRKSNGSGDPQLWQFGARGLSSLPHSLHGCNLMGDMDQKSSEVSGCPANVTCPSATGRLRSLPRNGAWTPSRSECERQELQLIGAPGEGKRAELASRQREGRAGLTLTILHTDTHRTCAPS
jgi:hypothetical protein